LSRCNYRVEYDAIILAGGRARRLGGVDKPLIEIRGVTLLETALAAAGGANSTVVVGPERPGLRDVTWVLEEPPGSGPVGALAAGMGSGSAPLVAVLAADLAFVTRSAVERLAAAVGDTDGAIAVDGSGRDQYLLAVYRRTSLQNSMDALPSTTGAPLATVAGALRLVRIRDDAAGTDCDTWDDVAGARRRSEEERVFEEWVDELCEALSVDPTEVDVDGLLDLSREVAHGIERRAAPVTTYLAGVAVGAGGDLEEVMAKITGLLGDRG